MRYARQKDSNHNAIAEALELAGATVMDLHHAGRGVPDLLVLFRGFVVAVEVKAGRFECERDDRSLTEAEEAWRKKWVAGGGDYRIIESVPHALEMLGQYRDLAEGVRR